jgi:hypothetical protein
MAEDAAHVANKYIEDAKLQSTVADIEDVEYQPDRTILTQLEQKKTLGILIEKPTKTSVSSFEIKRIRSYNVKVKSDKNSCYIRSACCMEDGTIILADLYNRKLKRLHCFNHTVTAYCDLPKKPSQVCMINNAQVAVTMPLKKEVHFISTERKMKTIKKINTDFECYGLAYTNNNLYISDGDTSVYVYTLSGRKLNKFSKDPSGQKLFADIYSLAVSKDATRIYVADYENGLIVLDHNGQVITSFNDERLKGASCCYFTEAGSVLVSGFESNNVLQFTCDGELVGEIIKGDSGKMGNLSVLMEEGINGKGEILSVCCNQQWTMMCINRSTSDNIEVYDI